MNKPIRFLKAISSLKSKRTWGPFVETFERTRFDHAFSVSWSQGAEDLALQSLFGAQIQGKYIDIGAHHPSRFSVTRMLYEKGWSGVNVEANPELLSNFNKERPRDTNLNYAVGLQKKYQFKIFEEPALSTYVDEWHDRFLREGARIKREISIAGITLRELFNEYFPTIGPDLLVIDVEGADKEVLESLNLVTLEDRRRPNVIVLETTPPVKDALSSPAVVHALGVEYVPYLVLPMSTVVVKRDWTTSRV